MPDALLKADGTLCTIISELHTSYLLTIKHKIMTPYKSKSGKQSGVTAYEIGSDFITV